MTSRRLYIVSYPFRYLRLRDESGARIAFRDLITSIAIILAISSPFLLVGKINFAHKDGFVDKFGAFSALLTGFYVAGLLGVATFSATIGNLDDLIDEGKIVLRSDNDGESDLLLTRREYVCHMFGYLAVLSMIIAVGSILCVSIADGITSPHDHTFYLNRYSVFVSGGLYRALAVLFYAVLVTHLCVTTCHGLFYLMDRLYHKEPQIMPMADSDD